MKFALLIASFLTLAPSAQASSFRKYDSNATQLLTLVHQNCAKEFALAMKHANTVVDAEEVGSQGIDGIYRVITLVTGDAQSAPIFQTDLVAKLTIKRVAYRNNQISAPDAPTIWTTTCLLEDLRGAQ